MVDITINGQTFCGLFTVNGQIASSASLVPTSRTLTAGDNLVGGGDLSADRSFALSTNVDIAGTLDVTGLATVDVGLEFVATNANLGSTPADTLYLDDGTNYDSGTLVWGDKAVLLGAVSVGDPGFEQGGINIHGTVYDACLKSNEFGGSNQAGFVVHRHSTSFGANVLLARTNSDTASHAVMTDGQDIGSLIWAGYDGTDYEQTAVIRSIVDGTPGSNDMPGRLEFLTTPDGGFLPLLALTIDNAQNITAAGNVDIPGGTLDVGGLATFDADVALNSAGPDLTVGDGSGSPDFNIQKSNTGSAEIHWRTDSGSGLNTHWILGMYGSEDIIFARKSATGTTVDSPLRLDWSDGNAYFANDISAVEGTFTGDVILDSANAELTIGDGTGSVDLTFKQGTGGTDNSEINFLTNAGSGIQRLWIFAHTPASDNLEFKRRSSVNGSGIDVPLALSHSTGNVTLANNLIVGGQMYAAADSSAVVTANAITLDFDDGNTLVVDLSPAGATVAITMTNVKEGAVYNIQLLGGTNGAAALPVTFASSGHTFQWGGGDTQPADTEDGEWDWYVFNLVGTVIHSRKLTP